MEFTAPCYHETIEGTVPEKFTNSQKAGEAERQRSNRECLKIGCGANFFLGSSLTEATGVPRAHSLEKISQYFLLASYPETIECANFTKKFLQLKFLKKFPKKFTAG